MSDPRVDAMTKKMQQYFSEFEPAQLRLLLWALHQLAQGRSLTAAQVDQRIAELGIAPDAAYRTLREMTEQNAGGQIVGAIGLSLGDHPHRLSVAGTPLSAWCALDALFLPALLQQTVTIESPSPVTHRPIRLRVSPERVEDVSPASAVVSWVLVAPRREDLASVEAVWSAFCHNVHFFPTREEAEQWTAGREDIAILTVDEGFELGQRAWARVLLCQAE